MSLAFIPASFSNGQYGFARAGQKDLPRIRTWLLSPHLNGWWTPNEDELSAAISDQDGQAAYIADHQGFPFAYIYVCDPAHDPALSEQIDYPKGTVRIDQFIGDGDMVGHGHGVKFLKSFVAAMKETPGIEKLIALPARDNLFSQRSFSQAGFRAERAIDYQGQPYTLMSLPVA